MTKEEHVVICPRAEASFQEGVRLLESGRSRQALSPLKSAIEIERLGKHGDCRQARYLSYYGLGLCITRTDFRGALVLCRSAARLERQDAMIWWNLGRVALALGRRGDAYSALRRARRLAPHDSAIARDVEFLGKRRPPVLSFLTREHPVNVLLGRMRVSLTAKRVPVRNAGPEERRPVEILEAS